MNRFALALFGAVLTAAETMAAPLPSEDESASASASASTSALPEEASSYGRLSYPEALGYTALMMVTIVGGMVLSRTEDPVGKLKAFALDSFRRVVGDDNGTGAEQGQSQQPRAAGGAVLH